MKRGEKSLSLDILARTVYGEARGEDAHTRLAVAYVVCNRLQSGGWGKTIAEVCQAPKQFSCWNAGDPNRVVIEAVTLEDRTFRACVLVAVKALHRLLPDPTHGADHYLNESWVRAHGRLPSWFEEATVTASIGAHTFLRLR